MHLHDLLRLGGLANLTESMARAVLYALPLKFEVDLSKFDAMAMAMADDGGGAGSQPLDTALVAGGGMGLNQEQRSFVAQHASKEEWLVSLWREFGRLRQTAGFAGDRELDELAESAAEEEPFEPLDDEDELVRPDLESSGAISFDEIGMGGGGMGGGGGGGGAPPPVAAAVAVGSSRQSECADDSPFDRDAISLGDEISLGDSISPSGGGRGRRGARDGARGRAEPDWPSQMPPELSYRDGASPAWKPSPMWKRAQSAVPGAIPPRPLEACHPSAVPGAIPPRPLEACHPPKLGASSTALSTALRAARGSRAHDGAGPRGSFRLLRASARLAPPPQLAASPNTALTPSPRPSSSSSSPTRRSVHPDSISPNTAPAASPRPSLRSSRTHGGTCPAGAASCWAGAASSPLPSPLGPRPRNASALLPAGDPLASAIVSATDSTTGQLDVPDTARAARERLVQRLRKLSASDSKGAVLLSFASSTPAEVIADVIIDELDKYLALPNEAPNMALPNEAPNMALPNEAPSMALPNEAPAAGGSGPRRGTSSAMLSKPTAQLRLLKSKQVRSPLSSLDCL